MLRAQEQTDTRIFKAYDNREPKCHRKYLILCLSVTPGAAIPRGWMPPHSIPPQAASQQNELRAAKQWGAEGIRASFGTTLAQWGASSITQHRQTGEQLPQAQSLSWLYPCIPSPTTMPSSRETPCTHHHLHHLPPCVCTVQPRENQERTSWVRGCRQQISIHTGTLKSFKTLRAWTLHRPGFRGQGIPKVIHRERLTSATKTPQAEETPHVLPANRHSPDIDLAPNPPRTNITGSFAIDFKPKTKTISWLNSFTDEQIPCDLCLMD